MHDVSRDSLLRKQWDKKKDQHSGNAHIHPEAEEHHAHHEHEHHNHDSTSTDEGHGHRHHQHSYHAHDHDEHSHEHGDEHSHEDFSHQHGHRHVFYHSHPHEHDRVRRTLVHRVLKDPVRDWFAVGLILLLIALGLIHIVPSPLNGGLFLVAALIGLFPAMKNAVLLFLHERKPSVEIVAVILLLAILFSGHFFEAAIAGLFMLLGSFLRLDFSWSEH